MLTKEQMDEFFLRLKGEEGCDFREDDNGKMTWKCKGGNDKTYSLQILKKMSISQSEIDEFLNFCHINEGHCDCEIIFNINDS